MTDKNNNTQVWSKQFIKSLDNWQQAQGWYDPLEERRLISIDEWLNKLFDPAVDSNFFFLTSIRALFCDYINHISSPLRRAKELCESPIEYAFLTALTVIAIDEHCNIAYVIKGHQYDMSHRLGVDLLIEPQAQLGDYRVDFLLTHQMYSTEGAIKSSARMVVDCDGHEYHERTKEQAKRDRQRDRVIQSIGMKVFRYTGSEIWADVFKCAKDALDEVVATTYLQLPEDERPLFFDKKDE